MGGSDGESAPKQPDGGLLSLLGDLFFAGAILVVIYPCLRRSINRIDRQFCRQFCYISEVILGLAALGFVLMLMIAQQTRMTYCSFIRPYMGDHPEDEIYAGVLLKILVCALLGFNYICASGFHRIFNALSRSVRVPEINPGSASRATSRPARSVTPREVLSNNSNTNSQTPVLPTATHSDIISSISVPSLDSESFQDQSKTVETQPRLYCDVGTMARFPEYQSSLCTLQFCKGQVTQVVHSSGTGASQKPSFRITPPHSSSSTHLHSPTAGSTGFCVASQSFSESCPANASSSHHSLDNAPVSPAGVARRHQVVQSNCKRGPGAAHRQTRSRSSLSCASNNNGYPNNLRQSGIQSKDHDVHQRERCPGECSHPSVEEGDDQVNGVSTVDSYRSRSAATPSCSCYREPVDRNCAALFRLPHHSSTIQVRKRSHPLPFMPKMTRSGKIYGYG